MGAWDLRLSEIVEIYGLYGPGFKAQKPQRREPDRPVYRKNPLCNESHASS